MVGGVRGDEFCCGEEGGGTTAGACLSAVDGNWRVPVKGVVAGDDGGGLVGDRDDDAPGSARALEGAAAVPSTALPAGSKSGMYMLTRHRICKKHFHTCLRFAHCQDRELYSHCEPTGGSCPWMLCMKLASSCAVSGAMSTASQSHSPRNNTKMLLEQGNS